MVDQNRRAPRGWIEEAMRAAWPFVAVAVLGTVYPRVFTPYLPWLLAGAILIVLLDRGHLGPRTR